MARRIFYVLYFDDSRLQACLDAMRFIANPMAKSRAHITVRGPYSQSYEMRRQQEKIRGTEVLADGIGAFLTKDQNTVYIRCHATTLQEVWRKRDFGFNPHITVYDGRSREFAKTLLNKLGSMTIRFHFVVNEMSPLESQKGQYTTWLRESFDENFVSSIVGSPVEISAIAKLACEERMHLLASLARSLSTFSSSPVYASEVEEWDHEVQQRLVTITEQR